MSPHSTDLVNHLRTGDESHHWDLRYEAADEIERLRASLATANANHEKFEREWYLRGDEIEQLRRDLAIQAVNAKTVTDLQAQVAKLSTPFHEREPPHCSTCSCEAVPEHWLRPADDVPCSKE